MTTRQSRLSVVFMTYSFPFGKGEEFLETEIIYLARRFQRVTLVPSVVTGEQRPIPENVIVDTSLAETRVQGIRRPLQAIFACLMSSIFYREVISHIWALWNWKAFSRIIIYHDNATRVYHWLSAYLSRSDVDPADMLFYTAWLVPQSVGVYLTKRKFPNINYISRAHRNDLEEINTPPYLPFRRQTFLATDYIFLISEGGRRYIEDHYSAFKPACEVVRIGVNDPGFDNMPSPDGIFRVVSCSFIIPLKRLHLIVEGLRLFTLNHPGVPVEWHHLGDGPLRQEIENRVHEHLPQTVSCFFHGHIPNKAVMNIYRDNPFDLFINVSLTEGIPVAIMESQSCGIPSIATAVGGTPEIVNSENGILLDSDPTPEAIASALAEFALHPDQAASRRHASKETWRTFYNAPENCNHLIDRIIERFGE